MHCCYDTAIAQCPHGSCHRPGGVGADPALPAALRYLCVALAEVRIVWANRRRAHVGGADSGKRLATAHSLDSPPCVLGGGHGRTGMHHRGVFTREAASPDGSCLLAGNAAVQCPYGFRGESPRTAGTRRLRGRSTLCLRKSRKKCGIAVAARPSATRLSKPTG